MGLKQPKNLRRRFFLPTLFCAFLRTYVLVHCRKSVSQMLNLDTASNLFAWTVMGLQCGAPFLPLGYTFWCSVKTPELLVVAFHRALFIASGFAFHHSFIHHFLLITSLENNMALAETISFTTLRLLYAGWFNNAYQPNMWLPVTPLCKPL